MIQKSLFRRIALAALMMSFGLSQSEAARRLQILFLGDNGHHQPHERYYELLQHLVPKGIDVDYTDRLDDLNPEKLALYDGVAIYANWDKIGEKSREQALLGYVREKGKGLIVLHCGSYCFRDSLEFVKLTGAQFMKHGMGEFDTKVTQPDHPIMKGFIPFKTTDETYVHTAHNPEGRTVLQTREDEPWTWVRNEGKGRVFYTAYGHDQRTWLQPSFGDLVLRGTKWAVGDAAAKDLNELGLKPFEYEEGAAVPNYEKRDPAPKLQKPLSPAEALKHISVPADMSVSLVASEKSKMGLWNVIDFKFDESGRLWTCESLDYPNEFKPQPEGRDRIRILEDSNGDGQLDKATVFAEKLCIPSSLVFTSRGSVIVTALPDTYEFKDTNNDGVSDSRTLLFTGWGAGNRQADTHATVSNLRYGHDNWIYGTVGYDGFNGTVGGEQLRFSQSCFRFQQDGSKLEVLGRTSNNTWGLGLDENGSIFGSTANNQHAWYIPISRRYYNSVADLEMGVVDGIETADSKRVAIVRDYVRMVDVFNKRERDFTWGYTACAGQTIYSDRLFPEAYWNKAALVCEPTAHVVARGWLERQGTNYSFTRGWNLMASDDEWFAPVQTEVAPDGSVYVSDFYSFLIQHNPTPSPTRGGFQATTGKGNAFVSDLRDTEHARIWRVSPKGKKAAWPKALSVHHPDTLLAALASHNMNARLHGQRLLIQRGKTDVVPDLKQLVAQTHLDLVGTNGGALHALWTLHGLQALDQETVTMALAHPSAGVRRAALKLISRDAVGLAAVTKASASTDKDPLVQLEALLALSEMPSDTTAGQSLATLGNDAALAKDKFLPIAINIAAARHASGFIKTVLANAKEKKTDPDNATPTPAKNLLVNEGAEELDGALPRGWRSIIHSGQGEFTSDSGHTGKGLKIASKNGGDVSWTQDVTLDPDSEYLWTGWIKTEGLSTEKGGKGAMLEIHSLNGKQPFSKVIKGTQDWTKVELKFNTRKQRKVTLNLLYGGWGLATGSAWWDDLALVKLSGPSAGKAGGTPDLAAIVKTFAQTAAPAQIAEIQATASAKQSDESRLVTDTLAKVGTAATTPKQPPVTLEELAKTHQILKVKSIEGLQFNVKELNASADKPIAIVFDNPDALQHNLVVVAPGALEKVGTASTLMAAQTDGAAKGYVPSMPEVLAASGLLNKDESAIVKLTGLKPGQYPFLCTFPGHWVIMKGVLNVK